jgi:heparosan-N-sulfate-glucuronate 5-epimerase
MLAGNSYYHVPQGLGKVFQAGKLQGYFNDMTGKTNWRGHLDEEGIPVCQLLDGSMCHFPTTIIQKALGHYDQYIFTKDDKELREFLKICNWLVKKQDERGGWDVGRLMRLKDGLKYSAMPQGEALSALVRAYNFTNEIQYLNAAAKAYQLMITTVEKGGTAYYQDNDLYLEECPAISRNTILNGWIFALFGIYDLFLATGKEAYGNVFEQSLNILIKALHMYDSGFWSYYDEQKSLSSPFYHDLHISQLEALFLVTGDRTIGCYIGKWKSYRRNLMKRYYAFLLKTYQKLRKPTEVVVVR